MTTITEPPEAGERPRTGTTVATRGAQAVTASGDPAKDGKIDGNRVLMQVYGYLGHMALWPSQAAQITATLYAAAAQARAEKAIHGTAYLLPVWTYMPRLFYTSPEGGSGKSWMARLTASMCPSPERLAEMTKASLVDIIAQQHTPVITELDTFVNTGGRNRWLTGIANVGYEFDGQTSRKHGGKVNHIPLFGPMILDGLDSVIHSTGTDLRTLMSRCIIVRVEKAPPGYRPPRYDREMIGFAQALNGRIARWMTQEVTGGIGDLAPTMPGHLGNRPFDLWEPLFAVAERAGGDWPLFAKYACENIETPGLPAPRDEDDAAKLDKFLASVGAPRPSLPDTADEPGWIVSEPEDEPDALDEFTPPQPPAEAPSRPTTVYYTAGYGKTRPGRNPVTASLDGTWDSLQDAQEACQDHADAPLAWESWEDGTWGAVSYGDDGTETAYAVTLVDTSSEEEQS